MKNQRGRMFNNSLQYMYLMTWAADVLFARGFIVVKIKGYKNTNKQIKQKINKSETHHNDSHTKLVLNPLNLR